ncbi:MAG TPA: phosphatase PAP2 family protein [Mycobacteriales bacterium]|nr:phosphatase PAP2 family protein [Mycobacteriales bacterium]
MSVVGQRPPPTTVSRPLGPPTWRLLAAAALATLVAAATYLLFVRTSLGQRFDNAALAGSHLQTASTRTTDISQLQRITADSFAVVLVVLAVIGILRRRPRLGIGAAIAAAVAVIGVDILKKYVLTRPELAHNTVLITGNTFPSGHTATAIACALALVMVTAPRWRGAAAVIGGSYAWITAAQVQTAGWHRPSDAIGAALLGFAAVATVAALLSRWRPNGYVEGARHRVALTLLGVIWLVAAATAGFEAVRVLHYLTVHDPSFTLTTAVEGDAYHFSVGVTIVVVVSLLMTLLVLLRGYDLDEPVA